MWDRHLLNCGVIAGAFPFATRVIDVGSGAGLPGIALAIARPDLDIHLVEPMLRRTTWLSDVINDLDLASVTVHRARAVELSTALSAPFVTARAVARLGKLARWCVPLMSGTGTLVAMKGRSAAVELTEDREDLVRLGLVDAKVSTHGAGLLDEPTMTVDLRFDRDRPAARREPSRSGR
ncbi:MAG: 16S rRNA (guanine(527)-N(7))-methyltransferase RsmG [Phycicoccus sp.]